MKLFALIVILFGLFFALARIETDTTLALTVYVALALGTVGLAAIDERRAR